MKPKQKVRVLIDLAMLVLMPLLMAYSLVGETAHEWLGIAMLVLFMLHHLLNLGWYKSLFRGKYTAFRIVLTAINILLVADFLLLFYSGIDLSKRLLPLLPELGSASLSRMLHLSGSHWGLVLMSVHLGLHMRRFATLFQKQKRIWAAVICLTACYGVYAFVANAFVSYLLPTSEYLFFDGSRPLIRLLADSSAIMVLFALLGHIAARLTQHKMKKEK